MKYIKRFNKFKLLENIDINYVPQTTPVKQLQSYLVGDIEKIEKEFDSDLLSEDFFNKIKDYLYDLSEISDIKISFLRTVPIFNKNISNWGTIKIGSQVRSEGYKDLFMIEIKSLDYYSTQIPRTQAVKREYISSEILQNTCLELQSYLSHEELNIAICESYLPFEKIEDFFKRKKSYLTDVSLIIFK
jgi:hypothetical protein